MTGAIIGDIAGSRFEWHNIKTKKFEFWTDRCFFTDDTVMSLAVCEAILHAKEDRSDLSAQAVKWMQKIGRHYPDCGYGGNFGYWIFSEDPMPYNSYGNGAAMRVSACGYAAESLEDCIRMARAVTEVTHDHPEGIKGAEATAVAVFLARTGKSMEEIRKHIEDHYYTIDFTLDDIRSDYDFDVSCQGSVPQALEAFFESTAFGDAIRNAISIGGDSDTIAAITGGIAGAFYGVSEKIHAHVRDYLDDRLMDILERFEDRYPEKLI